jgi:glutamyl-tRNA synthetase
VQTSLHPKNPELGERALRIAKEVFLEAADVEGLIVGEEIVLMRWGVVKITCVSDDKKSFAGELVPNGDFRAAKRKLTWVAYVAENTPTKLFEFDNLVSKDKIEEDENFEDFINPHTMAESSVIGDSGLKTLQKDEVIQLERRGYFRVESPYVNAARPLILYMIPDGKSKAMSGQTGKLAHR